MPSNAVPNAAPPTLKRPKWLAARIALALAAVMLVLGVQGVHPFLAVTDRIGSKVMIVEGWLPDYALEEAAAEYRKNGYQQIYTTGGPLERGSHLSEYHSFAEVAAATLVKLGVAADKVQAVPAEAKHRNRTYESARALKQFFGSHGVKVDSITLVTEGTHARRSRLCFRRALGRQVSVGVISVENRDYECNRWWRYSSGIKTILGESLAVLYAWLSIDDGD